ncbi:MAG: HAMP domain-containing histidine kinase [Rhodothermales bacterium]|nr:HAMP domain-containing histidine kinase [Rhodothermales bacterium]
MKAYQHSINLKLALILFALGIAALSLVYTQRVVDKLRDREQSIVQLWAGALEQIPKAGLQSINPHQQEFAAMVRALDEGTIQGDDSVLAAYRDAIRWAQSMPPASELSFIMDDLIIPDRFDIPAIVWDTGTDSPQAWRNVATDSTLAGSSEAEIQSVMADLRTIRGRMEAQHEPIQISLTFPGDPGSQLDQLVYYGESQLIRELRLYPYLQLLFIAIFVGLGYLGFSYVRRSEQRSLWVGMAKEAAHQLGTPISSLMGWTEMLKLPDVKEETLQTAVFEIEKDVERLERVAHRFSDIGSMPKLERVNLLKIVNQTAEYMRARMPSGRDSGSLLIEIPDDYYASLNPELFEWVIENLIKNALDAIEGKPSEISINATRSGGEFLIDVRDNGKGIDRRNWKNIFRPGYSTKKRGWGLGLSLAKRIIEDYHKGSLTLIQSRLDHGTTFRIAIPAD